MRTANVCGRQTELGRTTVGTVIEKKRLPAISSGQSVPRGVYFLSLNLVKLKVDKTNELIYLFVLN